MAKARCQLNTTQSDMRLDDAPHCKYLELLEDYDEKSSSGRVKLPAGSIVFKYQHDHRFFIRALATPDGENYVLNGHELITDFRRKPLLALRCRLLQEGESFTVTVVAP